ncbi:hypothetical protein K443DRAFT_367396, partial [Laccaria amethystina LaAM-08-1]
MWDSLTSHDPVPHLRRKSLCTPMYTNPGYLEFHLYVGVVVYYLLFLMRWSETLCISSTAISNFDDLHDPNLTCTFRYHSCTVGRCNASYCHHCLTTLSKLLLRSKSSSFS